MFVYKTYQKRRIMLKNGELCDKKCIWSSRIRTSIYTVHSVYCTLYSIPMYYTMPIDVLMLLTFIRFVSIILFPAKYISTFERSGQYLQFERLQQLSTHREALQNARGSLLCKPKSCVHLEHKMAQSAHEPFRFSRYDCIYCTSAVILKASE